jgi:spore coat polysaccharide biosynthesis protein SpsF
MILSILQARVSSMRLPEKVLKPILGRPMLLLQIERIKRATLIDRFILATSTDQSDDPVEKLCRENKITCVRGSLNDVLDRFYQAALPLNPDHVVRLTGDCPLADPVVIDQTISSHLQGGFDYTSNVVKPTFPDGLDVEIFRFSCLQQAWKEAKSPSQREHVTPFIHQQPDRYKIGSVTNPFDLSQLRWTVDEPDDFALITMIYEALYPGNPLFSMKDVLTYLDEKPQLKVYNTHFKRNEGFQKSLAEDKTLPRKDG